MQATRLRLPNSWVAGAIRRAPNAHSWAAHTKETNLNNLDEPEIILNLWYVHDDQGFIYSHRARAYLGVGPEAEKRVLLKTFADIDYLIADPFPVPERYFTKVSAQDERLPIAHVAITKIPGQKIALWEDAIQQLESRLPSQTSLNIPKSPIVCSSPLLGDDKGNIYPDYKEIDLL